MDILENFKDDYKLGVEKSLILWNIIHSYQGLCEYMHGILREKEKKELVLNHIEKVREEIDSYHKEYDSITPSKNLKYACSWGYTEKGLNK